MQIVIQSEAKNLDNIHLMLPRFFSFDCLNDNPYL